MASKKFCHIIWVVIIGGLSVISVSADPPTSADCTDDVPFADDESCTSYYQCFMIPGTGWYLVHTDCPSGGIWDDTNKVCVEGVCATPTTTTLAPTTTVGVTTQTTPTTSASTSPPGTTISTAVTTQSTITSGSTTSTSLGPTTPTPPPTFQCSAVGFFPHPTDPTKYYQCILVGAQFYYYVYSCPPNSCFQESSKVCVVGSCSGGVPPSTTTLSPPTTSSPPVTIVCNTQGSYPFPGSCTKYYKCLLIQNSFVYYVFECPPNSYYDPATSLCANGPCPSSTTAAVTVPTTTTPSTTTVAGPSHPCPSEGYFSDPDNCGAYYRCVMISGQMYRYMYTCPAGSYWNSNLQGCIVGACPSAGQLQFIEIDEDDDNNSTTSQESTSTDVLITTTTASSSIICTETGFFPHPTNCTMYYQCVQSNGEFYFYTYQCPPFTKFDLTLKLCVVGVC